MRREAIVAFALLLSASAEGETLRDKLEAASVPVAKFAAGELSRKITSYAVSNGDPFLIAYYEDHGSGSLQGPLHLLRYSRKTEELRRMDVKRDVAGAATNIRERGDYIFVDTHYGPSAGVLLVFDAGLSVEAELGGWLLGTMGSDYAIIELSEMHFQPVEPLRIEAYDLKNRRSLRIYPYEGDRFRKEYSELLGKYLSMDWCRIHNSSCKPDVFNTWPPTPLTISESARVFGFQTEFHSDGFGDAASAYVRSRKVVYVFRENQGIWQHREFDPAELPGRFGVESIEELVRRKPLAAFQ